MSVKIRCRACSAVHAVHHRMLGKTIKCPTCTAEIQVPTAEQIEAAKKPRKDVDIPGLKSSAAEAQLATQVTRVSTAVEDNWEGSSANSAAIPALEKEFAASLTSFRRPKKPPSDDMDMTPMVDVTFLLLIFFMITASFAVQKSIQRPTQKSDAPSANVQQDEQDKDSLIIQVDEFNAYNLILSGADTAAGSKQDLIVTLKDYQAATNAGERATKLVVDAHENCIHSAVVDALDAGREAGFENFEVRTVEQFD